MKDLPPLAPLGDADDPLSDEEDSDSVMLDAGALDDDAAHPPSSTHPIQSWLPTLALRRVISRMGDSRIWRVFVGQWI